MAIFILFFIITLFSYYLAIYFSSKNNIYDIPNNRKIHSKPVLCIGGVYFFLCVFSSIFFYIIFSKALKFSIEYQPVKFLLNIFLVIIFFLIIGIRDDKSGVDSFKKIIFFFLINLFFFSFLDLETRIYKINSLILGEIKLDHISSVILPAMLFTFFIIFLGLIDGINCLLSIISLILLIILIFNLSFEIYSYPSILLVLVIMFLFVFIYNNFNSKVFLGNSGSIILAFLVAELYYLNYQKLGNKMLSNIEILIISIWFIIFDVIRVFKQRLNRNISLFTPDKKFFHHILISKNSLIKSLLIYIFLNFFPVILILFYLS